MQTITAPRTGSLPAAAVDALRPRFDQLAADAHVQGDFIAPRRQYAEGTWQDGRIMWGRSRARVEPLADGAKPTVEGVVRHVLEENHLDGRTYSVGVHMIRVVADDAHNGVPAPEGVHQDGFDLVLTSIVDLRNVSGGYDSLLDREDNLLQSMILQPAEYLLFDDRAYRHYASPITPALPGEAARDALVVTFEESAYRARS